jgi:hypothetical protein
MKFSIFLKILVHIPAMLCVLLAVFPGAMFGGSMGGAGVPA